MLEVSNDVDLVKSIKSLKLRTILGSVVSIGLSSFLLALMVAILIMGITGFPDVNTLSVPILNLFVQGNLWYGRSTIRFVEKKLEELSKSIEENTDKSYKIHSISDIEIIPKNIKLGSDLSHNNIVEIFKEGHYVLVHGYPEDVVIREYFDDEDLHVEILEGDEKDDALTEISVEEEIKKLTLRNRFTK